MAGILPAYLFEKQRMDGVWDMALTVLTVREITGVAGSSREDILTGILFILYGDQFLTQLFSVKE